MPRPDAKRQPATTATNANAAPALLPTAIVCHRSSPVIVARISATTATTTSAIGK